MRIWVKICGVTRVDDAVAAAEFGADAIGVNFHPGSVRHCSAERAREIVAAVARRIEVYGVFVDLDREAIRRIVDETGITGIQLHGGEDASLAGGWSIPVIRAVAAIGAAAVQRSLRDTHGARVLLDNPRGGGSGERFDPASVAGLDLHTAIVAGGLTPANVGDVVATLRPYGVDTAGGVEDRPGSKSKELMKGFIGNARSA